MATVRALHCLTALSAVLLKRSETETLRDRLNKPALALVQTFPRDQAG
jgi:hypothetical protein